MNRPRRNDVVVIAAAAQALLPALMQWIGSKDREADVLADVTDALQREGHGGAYQMAKYLDDRRYWSVDDDLLEILQRADHELYDAHEQATRDWVMAQGVTVCFVVDQKVTTPLGEGIVREVDQKKGRVTVFLPSSSQPRPSGYIGNVFDVESCAALAEATP